MTMIPQKSENFPQIFEPNFFFPGYSQTVFWMIYFQTQHIHWVGSWQCVYGFFYFFPRGACFTFKNLCDIRKSSSQCSPSCRKLTLRIKEHESRKNTLLCDNKLCYIYLQYKTFINLILTEDLPSDGGKIERRD